MSETLWTVIITAGLSCFGLLGVAAIQKWGTKRRDTNEQLLKDYARLEGLLDRADEALEKAENKLEEYEKMKKEWEVREAQLVKRIEHLEDELALYRAQTGHTTGGV